jgi:polar amino acid transport system permease protein
MKPRALFFDSARSPSPGWVQGGWLFLLVSLLCAGVMNWAATQSGWNAVWQYHDLFWKGWLLTILISLSSLALSTLIGLGVALGRRSPFVPLRAVTLLYVEIVRGTPLLVQILFLFYVVGNGIEAIPSSQLESARAIGFTTPQIYRFVIAPQALRQILPALAGQFASLIKDSSLLSIIGLTEFTLAAQQVNSATYRTLESFIPLGVGYLVLTLPISLLSKQLEGHLRYET